MKTHIWILVLSLLTTCGRKDDERPPEHGQNLVGDTEFKPTNKVDGEFRGFQAINQLLRERLTDTDKRSFELRLYVEAAPANATGIDELLANGSLVDLLGAYKGDLLRASFANAKPNAMSMLLWYMVVDAVSKDLSGVCTDKLSANPSSLVHYLKSSILADVKAACEESRAEIPNHGPFLKLWRDLLEYDAPADEFLALWEELRQQLPAPTAERDPQVHISHFIAMALYNPYWLLK